MLDLIVTVSGNGFVIRISADCAGSGNGTGCGTGGIFLGIGPTLGLGAEGFVLGLATAASIVMLCFFGLGIIGRSNQNKVAAYGYLTLARNNLYGHVIVGYYFGSFHCDGVIGALGGFGNREEQVENNAVFGDLYGHAFVQGNESNLNRSNTVGNYGCAELGKDFIIAGFHTAESQSSSVVRYGEFNTDHTGIILQGYRYGNNVLTNACSSTYLEVGLHGDDQVGLFYLNLTFCIGKEGTATAYPVLFHTVLGGGGGFLCHVLKGVARSRDDFSSNGGLGVTLGILEYLFADFAGIISVITIINTGGFNRLMIGQTCAIVVAECGNRSFVVISANLTVIGKQTVSGTGSALSRHRKALGINTILRLGGFTAGASIVVSRLSGIGIVGGSNQNHVTLNGNVGSAIFNNQNVVGKINHLDGGYGYGIIALLGAIQNLELQGGEDAVLGKLNGSTGNVGDQCDLNGSLAILDYRITGNDQGFKVTLFHADQFQSGGVIGDLVFSAHEANVILNGNGNLNGIAILTLSLANNEDCIFGKCIYSSICSKYIGSESIFVLPLSGIQKLLSQADQLAVYIGVENSVGLFACKGYLNRQACLIGIQGGILGSVSHLPLISGAVCVHDVSVFTACHACFGSSGALLLVCYHQIGEGINVSQAVLTIGIGVAAIDNTKVTVIIRNYVRYVNGIGNAAAVVYLQVTDQ